MKDHVFVFLTFNDSLFTSSQSEIFESSEFSKFSLLFLFSHNLWLLFLFRHSDDLRVLSSAKCRSSKIEDALFMSFIYSKKGVDPE